MVCNERELFEDIFDVKNKKGFDYAYLYQGHEQGPTISRKSYPNQ